MAQLDLYRLPGMAGYVLEVQADLLAGLATTIVVPLLPRDSSPRPLERLNPVFDIDGGAYVMATHLMASVARRELGAPVAALGPGRYFDVINALDMLISGT